MSIWFGPRVKNYTATGENSWLKRYVEHLTGNIKQDLTAHCDGKAFRHRAEDIVYDESRTIKTALLDETEERRRETENLQKTLEQKLMQETEERIEVQGKRIDLLEGSLSGLEKSITITADAGATYFYTPPKGYRLKRIETVTAKLREGLFSPIDSPWVLKFFLYDSDDSSLFSGEIKEGTTTKLQILYSNNGEDCLGKGFYFDLYNFNKETDTLNRVGEGLYTVTINFTLETLTEERFGILETATNGITPNLKSITANAVKGRARGRAVRFDDVSPFEHQLSVKVHNSGELYYHPITDVKVRRYGKNLCDKKYIADASNWSQLNNSYWSIPVYVGKGNTVTVSYGNQLSSGLDFFAAVMTANSTEDAVTTWLYHNTSANLTKQKLTLTATEDYIYMRVTVDEINNGFQKFMPNIGDSLQIEIGTQATAFAEYVEPMYYSVKTEDGLVGIADGIMSLSPSMTLIADTERVAGLNNRVDFELEAEYNKDTNKVIEALTDETTELINEWRLINEVTLDEDAVVEFTADKDGNAFNLKKMKVLLKLPQLETQSQVWLSVWENSYYKVVAYSPNIATSATSPGVSIMGELTYAWQFSYCFFPTGEGALAQVYSFPKGHRHLDDINKPLSKISIALNSGMTTPLPAGTIIKFWGVDV